jgi:Family of unknown function (DUF6886)
MTLYHVSEEQNIEVLEPRRADGAEEALVWAIDDAHLRNYLTPRECPRVTFYAGPRTSVADRERFLGSSAAVVAIEAAWFPRMQSCRLFCYHLPADGFSSYDATAGYFVSRTSVKPVSVECISDSVSAILTRGVELRILPTLGSLRDAVIASTLEFSIIRWRNASPR